MQAVWAIIDHTARIPSQLGLLSTLYFLAWTANSARSIALGSPGGTPAPIPSGGCAAALQNGARSERNGAINKKAELPTLTPPASEGRPPLDFARGEGGNTLTD